ncbi:MAG: flagellar filament capping protein FliD [Acidobacteriota bacterium]
MSAAISFSGFNSIDFNQILNAIMAQEQVPVATMQARQQSLRAQSSAFATLATKLGPLESASSSLGRASALQERSVTTSDASVLTASSGTGAAIGTYHVVVRDVAHVQVTASSSHHADADATIATGGTVTIGGITVALAGDTTLRGLADTINATADIGVVASIVQDTEGYRLVLTGKSTGAANGFTVTNALTASSVSFTDTDLDGISGDSPDDNAMQASDADLLVNNVEVTSATNSVADAIPGVTLDLARTSPSSVVAVRVSENAESTRTLVESFVTAYNDLVEFAQQQTDATNGIGRDPLLRSLRSELRSNISARYTSGGILSSLALIGVEFDRTGKLTIDSAKLGEVLAADEEAARTLFAGDGTNPGVFSTIEETVGRYTGAGALLAETTDRIDDQVRALDQRLSAMEVRLALRREALQKEFMATDALISRLNGQMGALTSLGSQYSLF